MSGHSKWSNIKRQKGKQDAIKGKIYTKMGKLISIAAREGGPDPSTNGKLREAVAKAKANNMPNDNIERAIKKGAGELNNANFESITYEGYGIGGAAVIVEALTDNRNRTAGDVRYTFDKNGGNLGTSGCVSFMFNEQGSIFISAESTKLGEDELMELALDAGAEDFVASDEGYEITTSPQDFYTVLSALTDAGLKPESAEVAMVPTTTTELDDDQLKRFLKMLEMFDDNDDVQEVYHNVVLPEEDDED